MNFGQWCNQCLAHRLNTMSWSKLDPASWNDQKLPKQSLDDASNISIKRPNIAWNDKMRYKKDTKAKHVVSYTATRNLVKFLALTNLPVQCQCLLKLLLLLLLLLLPCSAAETTGFELSSLTNSRESWIFQNGNFYLWKHIVFHSSSIGDIFGFMSTGGALQSCFILARFCRTKPWIIFILFYYQSVLCDTSYVLCSIMHSSYISEFPLTIQISHH